MYSKLTLDKAEASTTKASSNVGKMCNIQSHIVKMYMIRGIKCCRKNLY